MTAVKAGFAVLRFTFQRVGARVKTVAISMARQRRAVARRTRSPDAEAQRTPADKPPAAAGPAPARKPLSAAAQRALAEAAVRRAEADRAAAEAARTRPKEYGGPQGPEPTRYGDWENKGIASDF